MSNQPNISDLDLHAYIDGELDAGQARTVEEAASRNGELAARIRAYRADKQMLKNVYAPLTDRPLPAEWVALAHAARPARARQSWGVAAAIAAMALVILGSVAFYAARNSSPDGDVVQTALSVRDNSVGVQKYVSVAGIAEARHYDLALRKIVDANVKVPELHSLGYRVTGIRFYARAAEIQYRDARGGLFTLYLRPSNGKTRFDQFKHDGLRVCVWQDDRISTVMAGAMSAAMMQRLASLTYLGLTT